MDRRVYERLRRIADEETRVLLRDLPPELRNRVRAVPVQFEPRPSRAQIRAGVEPDLMGLFEGEAIAEQTALPLPPTIFLFLENIYEEAAHDAATFRDEVRRTLMHEYGHFLGLDEDDLFARGVD
jgi:predicted Zn-dependent protease with MMP-like domain